MTKNKKIVVKGIEVVTFIEEKSDFISLTDIARYKNKEMTGLVISHWMSTRYTIEFLGIWEQIHNPGFNVTEFSNIRNESGSNGYALSSKQWIAKTNAIGVVAKPGRYGGTYAHKDIAFEFASWISPEFKLYLIKEFQRLKEEENRRIALGWDAKRMLTRVNYKVHTDAVKDNLIPKHILKSQINKIYASEADILNVALFGITAKQWRTSNEDKTGNMRDYSNVVQLVCLAGLESLNAEFIRQGLSQKERLIRLNKIAIIQMKSLTQSRKLKIGKESKK